MDARLVWDTWRRILTSDPLVDRVLHPGSAAGAELAGLSAQEVAIVDDYASSPAAADANIGMYRRGLVRNALGALSLVPLTRHLLYRSGLDVEAVAEDFVRSIGYADDGPYFWRIAGGFIGYLAGRPEFAAPSWQDVLALDAVTVALARQLGEAPVEVWPEEVAGAFHRDGARLDRGSARFLASRAAVVASTSHDLNPWLEDPQGFEVDRELEPSARHWLVHFPTADAAPAYAELSERTARAFNLLSEPRTAAELSASLDGLADADLREVLDGLAELGVVVAEGGTPRAKPVWLQQRFRPTEPASTANDAFVVLDPAVEILEGTFDENRLMCHGHFDVGMAVPPGEGLLAFVTALQAEPVSVAALREQFDDPPLIDRMLASLRSHGFVHVTSQAMPSGEELAGLRDAARQRRARTLRRTIAIDLDGPGPLERLRADMAWGGAPPEVSLRCARLADHKAALAELARLRQSGSVRMHDTVLHTGELTGDPELCQSLIRLGASVVLEGLPWPMPDRPIAGLAEMTRQRVAVHALMTPDLSILDGRVRECARDWAASVFISGLHLQLDADVLWPAADATEQAFVELFDAVRALEEDFGDVRIASLPSDEVVLGNAVPLAEAARPTPFAGRFRLAYLRWRIPLLKTCEGDNLFSQTPEAEEKIVPLREDLLPNHPELLSIGPGSVVVDVCGGNGRVARRLAPVVGPAGLVISFEMLRCVSDRARRFADEGNMTNLHFRTGLAQRIPLPDGTADAAVNEWTGAIWELGLGPAMVREMARVVRFGGRVAVTHRLVRLPLDRLGQPWVQYEEIHRWLREAFVHPELTIVAERVWGHIAPSLVGENASRWRKQYLPRLVDPFDFTFDSEDDPGPHVDILLAIVAERRCARPRQPE